MSTAATTTQKRRPLAAVRRFFDAISTPGKIGFVIVGLWILIAILAPLLTPYGPYQMQEGKELQPPSLEHPAGTDEFGRDILTRTFFGARFSIGIAFGGVLGALVVGSILGLIAGVFGGASETLVMRGADVLLSFPPILLGDRKSIV